MNILYCIIHLNISTEKKRFWCVLVVYRFCLTSDCRLVVEISFHKITALARGSWLSDCSPLTIATRAVVVRGSAVSQEHRQSRKNIAAKLGLLSLQQTFNDFIKSTSDRIKCFFILIFQILEGALSSRCSSLFQ